jgi:hypothetical protein
MIANLLLLLAWLALANLTLSNSALINLCAMCPAGGEDVSEYYCVLSALVSFLRDHDCWATLACLLGACQQVGGVRWGGQVLHGFIVHITWSALV